MEETLGKLGSEDEFSTEAFDQVFLTFDKDESGFVEKDEMVFFIMQLLAGTSWKVVSTISKIPKGYF